MCAWHLVARSWASSLLMLSHQWALPPSTVKMTKEHSVVGYRLMHGAEK